MLKKIIIFIMILLLIVIIGIILVVKYVPTVVGADWDDEPHFYEFSIEEDSVTLLGAFQSDLMSFHGYKYEYDGKNLYLKLYVHMYGLDCRETESLAVRINIKEDFKNLENIYLKDNNKKKRLIWSKNNDT
ncbi:hypothetical protein [Anaerovorax odorimutans]|uniref:hypothetical protein n=1 Tax=Anaerovorax odorimutans TaxID=109327 RepID=UPI00042736A8|nr:hypothetical protein [Anaerovorax odorimutans]